MMNNLEPKIIKANGDDFIIHFEHRYNGYRLDGTATQIVMFTDGSWQYQSNTSSDLTEDRDKARVWFEWSFCWRGIWEGRIYFRDDEYWSEEMETIPELWRQIEMAAKKYIRAIAEKDSHLLGEIEHDIEIR